MQAFNLPGIYHAWKAARCREPLNGLWRLASMVSWYAPTSWFLHFLLYLDC